MIRDVLENRTSDDSGLTSDETSGEHRFPPTSLALATPSRREKEPIFNPNCSPGIEPKKNLIPVVDLMTQSTSALLKRSPRQQRRVNGFPKTNGNLNFKNNNMVKTEKTTNEKESPSTTDSSPWEEHPKVPIPAPRRLKSSLNEPPVILRSSPEDSLNSYNGDFEDDEIFEEVDSPIQSQKTKDYVNLNELSSFKETGASHVYSDIIRTIPELPRHQNLIQFEQKLFRTAENCLSIVGEEGPSTSRTSGEQNGNYLAAPKRIGR
ncbi:hypothetical protein FO519_008016, partial [Halicephalobus sp. NKZ332]